MIVLRTFIHKKTCIPLPLHIVILDKQRLQINSSLVEYNNNATMGKTLKHNTKEEVGPECRERRNNANTSYILFLNIAHCQLFMFQVKKH